MVCSQYQTELATTQHQIQKHSNKQKNRSNNITTHTKYKSIANMSSEIELNKLADRYPFDISEIEQLIRCYSTITDTKNADTFLTKIALSSPYSYFFLPGDEMRRRVELVEEKILPPGFASSLRAAMSVDLFVDCANEGHPSLERFLEGVADCGQRGRKEALRVIWDCCSCFEDKIESSKIIDLCYRLSVAADVIILPEADAKCIVAKLESEHDSACLALERSLAQAGEGGCVTKETFFNWAETMAPMISTTLSTFMHNLLFHGKWIKHRLNFVLFQRPKLDQHSDIFEASHHPNLFALACTSPSLGGDWHNLYSRQFHGASMNRLQYSILGYKGPTLVVIETDKDAIIGGFFNTKWKKSKDYYGESSGFLFQLYPTLTVFNATGEGKNFIHLQDGLGFGGTKNMPRLFIPASMEACNAGVMDKTFQTGNLLPDDCLEKFNIKSIEVWGTGGEEAISKGLASRAKQREITDSAILQARVVKDKKPLVGDINLIDTNLYKHREEARGRSDFSVDEQHGGYKLERGQ